MPAVEARKPMAAGRKWLRSYFNGCAFKVFDAPVPSSLIKRNFLSVAEWLFRISGLALIGQHSRTFARTSLDGTHARARLRATLMQSWTKCTSYLLSE